MLKLKFVWYDLLKAPRLALSLQRMWIQFIGMGVGYILYLVATYAALLIAGYELKVAWAQFGLLPCLFTMGDTFPWISWALVGIGSVLFFFVYLLTNTAVSRAIYMTSKGNSFYSWKEAFAFAFRKIWSVIFTPVSLLVLIGLMILGALVVGLLGKIPFVGELGVSLFTIPWILGGLLLFFFAIVTVFATILVPSVIATTDEDAFEAIFQSFSIVWNQPLRLLFYQAITVVLSFLALGVFAFFLKEAIAIMNALFVSFMGGDFANLANNGQAMVQSWTLLAQTVIDKVYMTCSPMVFFSKEFIKIPTGDLPVTVVISSYLYAFGLLGIAGFVISYGLSTFTAGQTLAFILFKYHKDEENLLERKDSEEEVEEEENLETEEQVDDQKESTK